MSRVGNRFALPGSTNKEKSCVSPPILVKGRLANYIDRWISSSSNIRTFLLVSASRGSLDLRRVFSTFLPSLASRRQVIRKELSRYFFLRHC
uniref:Uncharacterized protein n=1 Tax=Utricularia reniformis TaxID=192314 RepID=A0A1Y0AYY7_9LAMI|nr:hypothetical protein AEK19_MT1369 [Utricularia reniformis]ART30374.1 hypothetical protein AEK19_MT1369 [Utricularia reniformis]